MSHAALVTIFQTWVQTWDKLSNIFWMHCFIHSHGHHFQKYTLTLSEQVSTYVLRHSVLVTISWAHYLCTYYVKCRHSHYLERELKREITFPTLWDCSRGPSKRGRYWEIRPQRPRDLMRAERNLVRWGKSCALREISRAEGTDFSISPEFWWSTDIL